MNIKLKYEGKIIMKKIVSFSVVLAMLFSLFAGIQTIAASETSASSATVYEDTAISDDITNSTKQSGTFTGGLRYSFSVGDSKLYDYSSNEDGSISFTRNSGNPGTSGNNADAYFNFSDANGDYYVLGSGKFIFKAKLTMNTSAYSMLLSVKGSNGGNSVTWYNNNEILSGGKFFGEMSCTSGATYDIELIYDFDNNTETCIVNDSTLVEETVAEMDKLKSFSLKWSGAKAAEGDKITWADIELIHRIDENVGELFVNDESEDGIVATVDVTKGQVNSELPDKCVIVVASYSGNELVACEVKTDVTLVVGENHLTCALGNANGGTTHKAFLWNSLTGLTPLK